MAWLNPYLIPHNELESTAPGLTNLALRPGESITYHYQPQARFTQEHKAICPAGTSGKSTASYANACLRWRPDLKTDFFRDTLSCEGFVSSGTGLVASVPVANMRVCTRLAYPISGRRTALDRTRCRQDGLLLRLNASAQPLITIHLPRSGQTIEPPMECDRCDYFADLTPWADGCDEYELTLSLPKGEFLRSILVETWCQLPRESLSRWYESGYPVRLAANPSTAIRNTPLDLLLRWRQDGKLRIYRRRFTAADVGQAFVPVPGPGVIQPVHMVLSVPSR